MSVRKRMQTLLGEMVKAPKLGTKARRVQRVRKNERIPGTNQKYIPSSREFLISDDGTEN